MLQYVIDDFRVFRKVSLSSNIIVKIYRIVYLYVPLISVSSPKAIIEKTDRQTASARKGQRILINLFSYTYYI